jgi:uncharacterized protein YndB with AHSA1/START domain
MYSMKSKKSEMNKTLEFDFSVDKVNRTITVTKEFEAELPLVWDAFTKSENLDKWWAPKPWKAKTKSMNFTEGGRWLYAMVSPEGEEQWCIQDYQKIQPQKRFTLSDAFTDSAGNIKKEMPTSKWEQSFTEHDDITLVTTRIVFEDRDQLEKILELGMKEGYKLALEGLDELLPSLKKARK